MSTEEVDVYVHFKHGPTATFTCTRAMYEAISRAMVDNPDGRLTVNADRGDLDITVREVSFMEVRPR